MAMQLDPLQCHDEGGDFPCCSIQIDSPGLLQIFAFEPRLDQPRVRIADPRLTLCQRNRQNCRERWLKPSEPVPLLLNLGYGLVNTRQT